MTMGISLAPMDKILVVTAKMMLGAVNTRVNARCIPLIKVKVDMLQKETVIFNTHHDMETPRLTSGPDC